MNAVQKIIQSWVGLYVPSQHVFTSSPLKPESGLVRGRYYLLQIFYHPWKRRLARLWLFILRHSFGLRVIAITGSAGKTTTKDMLSSLLATKYCVVSSRKNIDPVYNIPSTILRCTPFTKYLVLEYGIEFPGEMDFYLWMARPDVSLLTSISTTHTEFLKDENGVLFEKSKLLTALNDGGYAAVNGDDRKIQQFLQNYYGNVITAGFGNSNTLSASRIEIGDDYRTSFLVEYPEKGITEMSLSIPYLGEALVRNSLLAIAVGLHEGVTVKCLSEWGESLKVTAPHRMAVEQFPNNVVVIDDSYNSNPLAAKSALSVLSQIAKGQRTLAVLGEMKELGDRALVAHQEVGSYAGEIGIDSVYGYTTATHALIKAAAEGGVTDTRCLETQDELLSSVQKEVQKGDVAILIKGSRSLGMDFLVKALR